MMTLGFTLPGGSPPGDPSAGNGISPIPDQTAGGKFILLDANGAASEILVMNAPQRCTTGGLTMPL
jgi:hypothetical protein